MNLKTDRAQPQTGAIDPLAAMKTLAPAGKIGTAWFENLADLGSEITSFVAERIKEDTHTQHALLQCKTLADVQHVQAEFLQKAFDQYHAETGKLIEMTGDMAVKLQPKADKSS